MYSNNFSQIRVQRELTEKVAITKGVKQGDSLSPLFFRILMDKIVSYVKHPQHLSSSKSTGMLSSPVAYFLCMCLIAFSTSLFSIVGPLSSSLSCTSASIVISFGQFSESFKPYSKGSLIISVFDCF